MGVFLGRAPLSTRSPMRTVTSGLGSSRLSVVTACCSADAVSTIPISMVPGTVMCGSVMCAINITNLRSRPRTTAKDEDALFGE
jgi:hypothetical protein